MADPELSLRFNYDLSCEEVDVDKKETQKETIKKRSFNESSSSGSYCSVDSALTTETKPDTAFAGFNDSSWSNDHPPPDESVTNEEEEARCDPPPQKTKSAEVSEDLSQSSTLSYKDGEEWPTNTNKNVGNLSNNNNNNSSPRLSISSLHSETDTSTAPVSTCEEHTLPITLYCDQCHVCLCVACCERHRYGNDQKRKITTCPSPVFLDVVATEKRTQGLALIDSLASFKEQAIRESAFIDTLVSELSEKSERKCETLWNELEVLFTALRHRLALLISQLQTETHSQKSKLERKSLTWNSYVQKVDSLQSRLEDVLQPDTNNVELVSALKEIKPMTDSLDINKFVNMMETRSLSVDVEYSPEYSNLYQNASEFVLGEPCLIYPDATGDTDIQQTISDQSMAECTPDKEVQCDAGVNDAMQKSFMSNPFLIDEGCLDDLSITEESNFSYGSKVFPSSARRMSLRKTALKLDYKNSFTTSSSTSGNNSLQSSLTTVSDISSLMSDFENGARATNVFSPTQLISGARFDAIVEKERGSSFAECAIGSLESEFFPRQMPILKAVCQWSLLLEKNTYVRGLTVTEDDHIFVCDRSSKKITQFNPDGKLMSRCDVPGIPWDVCAASNSVLFVALPQKSKLLLLQRCTGKCLLAVSLAVSTGAKKYVSLTKVSNGVLACDHDANVDILDSNGSVISTIISSMNKTDTNVSHRICSGKFDDIFWMLNISLRTISCHRLDGELLIYHRIAFEDNTSDICADRYNCIYGCDKKRIYSLTLEGGENILWTFKQELKNHPRMCVNSTRDKLFVSYQIENKNILRVFTISPKFVMVTN